MNILVIDGNITRDAELKTVPTKNGPADLLKFSVAHNHWKTKETDFFECTIWGTRAKTLQPMVKKGSRVVVSGELNSSTYTSNTGEKRVALNLNVNHITTGLSANTAENDREIPF